MLLPQTRTQYQSLLDAAVFDMHDRPDAPAIFFVSTERPTESVTRAQFAAEVDVRRIQLAQLGVQPGDLIAIADVQSLDSVYHFWAAMQLGALPAMFAPLTEKLDRDIYFSRMSELVELSGVRLFITAASLVAELAERVACDVVSHERFRTANTDDIPGVPPIRPTAGHIAFLQHSSGTTGLQKGVALSHSAVLNQLASYSQSIELQADDVIVSWLPLYHDMGLIAGFLLPLMQGIPLVLMSPFDWVGRPASLLRAITEFGGTLCWLPNFAYNHCARRIRKRDMEGISLSSMRMFINCSEPVRAESHQMFLDKFERVGARADQFGVSYAMAENTFAVTQTGPGKPAKLDVVDQLVLLERGVAQPAADGADNSITHVSCGRVISGTRIKIIDGNGQTLADRHVGQVAIQSDCGLTEYYRRPDLRPFQDGWYLSGDMGYTANGELYIIGRAKDLIINAGKNVYPQDIEAIVNQVDGVHAGRAVVFGVADPREGTELIAVVAESDQTDPAERREIAKVIRQRVVSQSMVTVTFVEIVERQWLIKTSSGKISRAANRQKWLESRV